MLGAFREIDEDDRYDTRRVFDVLPALNPVDTSLYAELGIPLNRYQYGKLMIEAVGRRMTIRELVLELIDAHIKGFKPESDHEI